MDISTIAARLAANAQVFEHLLANVSDEQARWKPRPEKWSLLEVINHLADEERDDFRTRLDLTLHQPGVAWPGIDPPRWAVEREYNRRELAASLADFTRERGRSIEWLERLHQPDLSAAYRHPSLGAISAGDLLVSWLAHDLIHVRQMTRLHYEYLAETARAYSPGYAGDW